jgi:hypothetical protein
MYSSIYTQTINNNSEKGNEKIKLEDGEYHEEIQPNNSLMAIATVSGATDATLQSITPAKTDLTKIGYVQLMILLRLVMLIKFVFERFQKNFREVYLISNIISSDS